MNKDNDAEKNAPDRESKAADEFEAEIEYREEDQLLEDRAVQEDLNQGFDTGTHDFTHRGVNWPPSYRVKPSQSEASQDQKKDDSKDKA